MSDQEESNDIQTQLSESDHKKQHDLRVLANSLITSEQSLINNRMTWMMTFQGLLFASFALTASTTNDPDIKTIVTDIIPYTGLAAAIIPLVGIRAAFISISTIKETLDDKLKPFGITAKDGLMPYGNKLASNLGRANAYAFPVIVALTWGRIAYRVEKIKASKKDLVLIQSKSYAQSIMQKKDTTIYNKSIK